MIDKNVEFYLFGNNEGHVGLGIRSEKEHWSCPFVGMVAYKITMEQLVALDELADTLLGIDDAYAPFVTTAGALRKVGIDIGQWGFGFLGDVTPKDDEKMLMLQTDSEHIIWLHHHVE